MTEAPGNRRPLTRFAERLGVTEGQVSTTIVAVLVAIVLTVGGLVPVLRHPSELARNDASAPGPVIPPPLAPERPSAVVEGPRDSASDAASAPRPAADVGIAAPAPEPDPVRSNDGGPPTTSPSDTPPQPSGPTRYPDVPETGSVQMFASLQDQVMGLAVAPDGIVYVVTSSAERGAFVRSFLPDGRAAASQELPTAAQSPSAVAAGPGGEVYVADGERGVVIRFGELPGSPREVARIPDIGPCPLAIAPERGCEPGLGDDPPSVAGLVVDESGTLYVSDSGQGTIWRVPSDRTSAEALLTDAAFVTSDSLGGLSLDTNGDLLIASPQSLDPRAQAGGALYRVAIRGANVGSLEPIARFLPGESPISVSPAGDGRFAVALRDAGSVVLVAADGAEQRRIVGDGAGAQPTSPVAAMFHGAALLVANNDPENGRSHGILAVGIL